jgi:hypothetical protein
MPIPFMRSKNQHAQRYVHFFCNLSCSSFFFCFLRRYHTSHVMMKIGRMSAPGTSSNKDTIPIQRNITRQAIIPTTSNMSPTTGKSKTAATYSLMSNTIQSTSENNSTSLKTKYSGKGLNSLFRSPKPLSSYNNIKNISEEKYKMRLRARVMFYRCAHKKREVGLPLERGF